MNLASLAGAIFGLFVGGFFGGLLGSLLDSVWAVLGYVWWGGVLGAWGLGVAFALIVWFDRS
jgi:hypothetical protein